MFILACIRALELIYDLIRTVLVHINNQFQYMFFSILKIFFQLYLAHKPNYPINLRSQN